MRRRTVCDSLNCRSVVLPSLVREVGQFLRVSAGRQPFGHDAPVNLGMSNAAIAQCLHGSALLDELRAVDPRPGAAFGNVVGGDDAFGEQERGNIRQRGLFRHVWLAADGDGPVLHVVPQRGAAIGDGPPALGFALVDRGEHVHVVRRLQNLDVEVACLGGGAELLAEGFQARQVVFVLAVSIGQEGLDAGLQIVGRGLGQQPRCPQADLGVAVRRDGFVECWPGEPAHPGEFDLGFLPLAENLAAESANEVACLRQLLW